MTLDEMDKVASIVQAAATSFALVAGGIWAGLRSHRERERHPHIEFTADIVYVLAQGDSWVVELVSTVTNKGKVQHRIEQFEFDLSILTLGEPVTTSEAFGGQALFPTEVARGSWLPAGMKYFFIEPGVTAKYSYVARVPKTASALMLHSSFSYPDGKHRHTAERTLAVPRERQDSAQAQAAAAPDASIGLLVPPIAEAALPIRASAESDAK